jgi:hypothetical protein
MGKSRRDGVFTNQQAQHPLAVRLAKPKDDSVTPSTGSLVTYYTDHYSTNPHDRGVLEFTFGYIMRHGKIPQLALVALFLGRDMFASLKGVSLRIVFTKNAWLAGMVNDVQDNGRLYSCFLDTLPIAFFDS